MKGRKPTPRVVKELTGNPGKRRMRREPKAPGDLRLMQPPAELDERAQVEWEWTLRNAPLGVLRRVDRSLLAVYCQCVSDFWQAHALVREHGVVLVQTVGRSKRVVLARNPAQIEKRGLAEKIGQIAEKLGLPPVARARLDVAPGDHGEESEGGGAIDPAEAHLSH